MSDNSQFETNYSDLLVYFGQWLAHDFAEILDTKRNDEFVDCPCGSTDPDCLAYEVPTGDAQLTQTCFEVIDFLKYNLTQPFIFLFILKI